MINGYVRLSLIDRIDLHIRQENTDKQTVFASKLKISRSSLNTYINYMRTELKLKIKFCRTRQT